MLHYFLWDFLPCIIVHVSPSVIISKAAVETKGPLQTSNDLWLSASVEKHSPQITCSTVYDVIVSTFLVCRRGKAASASQFAGRLVPALVLLMHGAALVIRKRTI